LAYRPINRRRLAWAIAWELIHGSHLIAAVT
jgi:hypothetical protein